MKQEYSVLIFTYKHGLKVFRSFKYRICITILNEMKSLRMTVYLVLHL